MALGPSHMPALALEQARERELGPGLEREPDAVQALDHSRLQTHQKRADNTVLW